jgi:endo-1,4-beta-xylanase
MPVAAASHARAFTIGSFTGYAVVDETADGRKLRETYLRLFNRATCPIYWADWGWPNQKTKYLAIAKWLADNHFTTRGHVMVYPTYKFMPADVVKMKDDPAKLRQRILQQVREISEATKPFGFREYDVTNELRDCVDLHKLLGRDAVAEWYAEARKILPNAKLALNENTILTSGGVTKAQQDLYLDWYNFLKSKGQAPDVVGFQGHFGEDVTAPETVWAILDRFAKETDAELQITEFDVNTLDEEAQAAYTRDFITACFAHPRITGFTMWGFWEGDHWLPRAALWRKDWSAKPNAIVLEELLTKTWWTNATVVADGSGRAVVKAFLGDHEVSATVSGRKIDARAVLGEAGKVVTVKIKP